MKSTNFQNNHLDFFMYRVTSVVFAKHPMELEMMHCVNNSIFWYTLLQPRVIYAVE